MTLPPPEDRPTRAEADRDAADDHLDPPHTPDGCAWCVGLGEAS